MCSAWTFARSATLGLTLRSPCLRREEERQARENNFADIEEQR
ncbi:hypothetical protein O987_14215 [Comamonas testosteroni TK102]|uniref:Uncharacterized protein n=1 Tax=Comamonas testosteroni TK102 TaxID=1392005 RepID=A0A076PJK0_COMTE|nr:hypothetical protein O987_14215 [Comamonas testosteroni TK102]